MKRLTLLLLMGAIAFIFASCCHDKTFSGYIPIGTKPEIVWLQDGYGCYSPSGRILVVCPPDTIIANFLPESYFLGNWLVKYRDSFPKAKDKVIYVELVNREDGEMLITEASWLPFE